MLEQHYIIWIASSPGGWAVFSNNTCYATLDINHATRVKEERAAELHATGMFIAFKSPTE